MRRFEFKDGKSNKFWEVQVQGKTLQVNFGRIGTEGQSKSKAFANPQQATAEMEKLIREKTGKGYVEAGASPSKGSKVGKLAKAIPKVIDLPKTKNKTKAPAEWVDGKIVLRAPPAKPLKGFGHERFRYNTLDFNVNHQFFLWYFSKLEERHKGRVWIKKSDVLFISPESAQLLKKYLRFFEQTCFEEKTNLASHKKEVKLAGKETLKIASANAGIDIKVLKQKLERLALLAKGEDINLAVNMITEFEDPWLFEALLAGTTIDKEGRLVAGETLKKFKEHAKFFGFLALVNAPLKTNLHLSLSISNLKDSLSLHGLTSLSDSAALALGKHKGYLHLRDLTSLSDSAAMGLSKHEGALNLNGLTSLSDAGAEALSKHEGDLCLGGLRSISDSAVESLSKLNGELSLYGLKRLSDAAAEALGKHKGSLFLEGLTSLSDSAANALGKHKGSLILNGLTSLSDAAAKALAKHEKHLRLDGLISLSDGAAEALSKYKGNLIFPCLRSLSDCPGHVALAEKLANEKADLVLSGLTNLSKDPAEALSKHEGNLLLPGLTTLSDDTANALSKHKGNLWLNGLKIISNAAAIALRNLKGSLWLNGLKNISDAAANALAQKSGGINKLKVPFWIMPEIQKHMK